MQFDLSMVLILATGISGAIWLGDAFLFARQRADEVVEPVLVTNARVFFLILLLVLAIRWFDFALILVLLTFGTGLIWLADTFYFAKRRVDAKQSKEPALVENAKAFFPILLLVLVIRSFVIEPFRIPSGSMLPTLEVGDFIAVNKFSYGVRLPVLNYKVIETGAPQRGDVAVFKYPKNPKLDYIKRVIGLPGDVIAYRGKVLHVNGEPVSQQYLGTYTVADPRESFIPPRVFEENLTGVEHQILIYPSRVNADIEVRVPRGHYFAMGDNRDDSNDSRMWGFVPEKNLVGKAMVIWLHWDLPFDFNWRRIGRGIH